MTWPIKPYSVGDHRYSILTYADQIVGGGLGGLTNILAPPFSAVGDNVADDTQAIQAALNSGAPVVVIPRPPVKYKVTDELVVTTPGQWILGYRSTLRQFTAQRALFDVQADDVTIEGIRAEAENPRVYSVLAPWRGGASYLRQTAFYTFANRLTVRDCEADNFISGVLLSPSHLGGAYADQHTDHVVDGFKVSNVDFGVLGDGLVRPRFDRISGTYSLSAGSPNPSHLLYLSTTIANQDVDVGSLLALAGSGGHALQLKGVAGGRVASVYARGTSGLLSLMDSSDIIFGTLESIDDQGGAGQGSLYVQTENTNLRHQFDRIFIDMAVAEKAARVAGTDCLYKSITIRPNRAVSNNLVDVSIIGTRNAVEELTVLNKGVGGAVAATMEAGIGTGANALRSLRATGCFYGAWLQNGNDLVPVVRINAAEITFAAGLTNSGTAATARAINISGGLTSTATVERAPRTTQLTQAGVGYQVREDASAYDGVEILVTDANGFAIQNLWSPGKGLCVTYRVVNTTVGAMGVITWGVQYKLAGAFVNPGAGTSRSITFRFDGTNWIEVTRTAADVPN